MVSREIIVPVLERFAPELVLLSAGYDAHEQDPLASMRMTAQGYRRLVGDVAGVALRHGQIAAAMEGGYDLPALAACLEASIGALAGSPAPAAPARSSTAPGAAARGERAVAAARRALTPFWRGI
jgi:acetoin utilization deacetylase AcuC-like enzyme